MKKNKKKRTAMYYLIRADIEKKRSENKIKFQKDAS